MNHFLELITDGGIDSTIFEFSVLLSEGTNAAEAMRQPIRTGSFW